MLSLLHIHTDETVIGVWAQDFAQGHFDMQLEPGIEQQNFRLVDDPLYILNHSHFKEQNQMNLLVLLRDHQSH